MRIKGRPIGGEDRQTAVWRKVVADAARPAGLRDVRSISLHFTLEPGRRVDVDNLARPALEGLRDAGWFGHGFKTLDLLVVSKSHGEDAGLDVAAGADVVVGADSDVEFSIASMGPIPTDGKHEVRRAWFEAVRAAWAKPPLEGPLDVRFSFHTTASLVGLMKVNIDALEPVLGRDPRGRLTYCPLDDKIERLEVRRVRGDVELLVEFRRLR